MENSIVEDWLRSLQLFQYSQGFIDNGYDDLEICKKIDEPDLDAIGVVNPVHRDRILNAVKILLEQGGTAVYFTLEEASLSPCPPSGVTESDRISSPASSIGTTASVSSTETKRTSDNTSVISGPVNAESLGNTVAPKSPVDYLHDYQEQSAANLVKIPRLQLKMLIRDRLVAEGIRLSSSPYTNPDGSRGFLEGLASRYAEQLRTHYQDVLERLGELWTRMVSSEINRTSVIDIRSSDGSSGNAIYTPGIYSPSSCLSDHDEELIYGYTKYPPWYRNTEETSARCFNSRSPNLYDSDGYYSIGFNDTDTDSPSIKKKSGIGKFLKVLSSKKDKGSPKNVNKLQRTHLNNTPLVERGNKSFHDRNDSYRLKSPIDDERLKIMLLASEGKISVKSAIERVKFIEADRCNGIQQENLDVLSSIRKSVEKIPGSGQVLSDPSLNYCSESSRNHHSSHFYDDPPYESEDSECGKSNEKSRRKFRCRKSRQDKIKPHRQSSSTRGAEMSRDKSSASMNGSSHCHERSLSPDEFKAHILARSRQNLNKRLLTHVTHSSPNTPIHYHHEAGQDIITLSSSCTPSPAYCRSNNHQNKCSDYASSPVTSRRQRLGMLTRIKQLTSRSSLSADEEVGYSPSSEYDEKDDMEMGKIEHPASREFSGRPSTIVGKMKVLRRDVKRKISKLRSSRGSESEADGALSSMVICHSSSVESLEDATQESILTNQVLTTTTTTTASSSNRSSASVDGDPHVGWNGPIIARAQALVDCTPSPYDHDALKFKRGQIIEVISMDQSGIWRGICDDQIGTFKFINVKVIAHEQRKQRSRHHSKKRYSKKSKPKSVDELLRRINLEQYVSVFMLNGYENLELFQEIDEEDLDYLGIVEPEHRAKLITAAELLHDYSESPDRDHNTTDKVSVPQEVPIPSTMETSVSFDTVFKYKQSPHDSGCFASSENVHRKESSENQAFDAGNQPVTAVDSEFSQSESGIHSSEGVDSIILSSMNNLDVTVCGSEDAKKCPSSNSLLNVRWPKAGTNTEATGETSGVANLNIPHSEPNTKIQGTEYGNNCDDKASSRPSKGNSVTKHKHKTPPPIPSRAVVPANLDQLKQQSCSRQSSNNDNSSTAPIQPAYSIPPIDHHLWAEDAGSNNLFASSPKSNSQERRGSTSKSKKGRGLELNLSKKTCNSKGYGRSGGQKSLSSQDMYNQALMNQAVHKLNAEGINLAAAPYTDKTGFCGIPPALVQRYTEELDQDMAIMAKILDRIRIIHLKMQGRVGVPNDFLIDSCTSPVIEAKYKSVYDWTVSLGLPMYYECFHQMGFTEFDKCSNMTEKDLNTCHVKDARHLQKFVRAIETLRFHLQN